MPAGRPLKFGTVKELQDKVDAYFKMCDEKQKPYTITGLALALDTNRETLLEYQGEVEGREKAKEYADTIKKAKEKIHNYAEESLWKPKIAAGVIFNLKNNWKWKDKSEIEHGGKMEIVIEKQ